MHIVSGLLRVTIKYTTPHGRQTIYQRHIPSALRDRYGKARIKVFIPSQDPRVVAREAARLTAEVEAEWAALRGDPTATPQAIKAHADAYLRGWGLAPMDGRKLAGGSPEDGPTALDLLHAHWDDKRHSLAAGDEHAYRDAAPGEYLAPIERAAWDRLYSPPKDTVTDLMGVYIAAHRKRDNAQWRTATQRSFAALVTVIGNVAALQVDRDDARRFIQARLDGGSSTGTVRRLLNVYGAAWKSYRLEKKLKSSEWDNPFEALAIPDEGLDAKKRGSFTSDQLAELYAACRTADDDMRWLFALMLDTGARLAEVVGLLVSDLRLDGPVPYVALVNHPWRTIKGRRGIPGPPRNVPLVGASLWAARRVVERAREMAGTDAAVYAFPRYTGLNEDTGEVECKATNASNALVKWIRSQGVDGLNHELRHTLIDRLREVGCPRDVRMMITGHTSQDQHDNYGQGHTLATRHEWLLKVALPDPPTL